MLFNKHIFKITFHSRKKYLKEKSYNYFYINNNK